MVVNKYINISKCIYIYKCIYAYMNMYIGVYIQICVVKPKVCEMGWEQRHECFCPTYEINR